MSDARNVNMAKIAANVEDEHYLEDEALQDDELDSRLSTEDKINAERLKQAELKTQMHINRLEKAKAAATSDAVKAKLQEEIDQAKQRKDEEAARRKAELKTIKTATTIAQTGAQVGSSVSGAASKTVDRVQETVGNVAGTLESVSTPGSIFLPIAILLIFFFLILPVNGMTRAQWLWLSLIGDAQIQPGGASQDTGSGQGGGGEPAPITSGTKEFSGVIFNG